jgi:hypothetical protein
VPGEGELGLEDVARVNVVVAAEHVCGEVLDVAFEGPVLGFLVVGGFLHVGLGADLAALAGLDVGAVLCE